MPNSPKRDYSQERKFGRIGGSLRAAGSVLRAVGKTLAQSGSPVREQMIKKHGKYYTMPYGKGGTTIAGEKGMRWAQSMKYTDPYKKKAIQYMIGRRDPQKKWSPGRRGLTEEMIRKEAYPLFVQEFGEKGAQELMKALTLDGDSAHSKYAGGKEVMLDKALKDLERAKNVRREQRPIAEQILMGLLPPFEHPSQKGLTQEKLAEVAGEAEKKFGKETAFQLEKTFGVVREGEQAKKQKMPAQRRIVGLREGLGLGGWGRRASGGDAESSAATNIKKAS